ncbi:hypothetical protein SAMN02745216_01034 [Desulfatibacillum alkenivorans DSM 16219]|jgi:hypothetical protein|uniref:SpoIIAA-like n=1 Tax=Desulfatibacillum alkenivorans DSM 16219 TaxID=1121393 RepID=A0A1M6GKB2_9BACT|nr:hypothetical protein [Desulfatibacillum alkenivorans]SHJ10326.1 hypothetical protein SAMN02745216_01034 [Desulfatibacillum alkenivorans DSM 16219]
MGISLDMNEDIGILVVTYLPEPVTPNDLAKQRKMVADALSSSGIQKVLIDASSLLRFPPIVAALEHNEKIAADEKLKTIKYAVLCSSLGQDERSLETTGINRGIYLKCFSSRKDALSWLVEKQEK